MNITLKCPGCGSVQGEITNASPFKTYETNIYYCVPCSAKIPRKPFDREEFKRFILKHPKNKDEALLMAKRLEERRFE